MPSPISVTASAAPSICPLSHDPFRLQRNLLPLAVERIRFSRGANYRMNHYRAAILLQEIDNLVTDTERRRANADYLTDGLKEIP